jgi:hypothetical protein
MMLIRSSSALAVAILLLRSAPLLAQRTDPLSGLRNLPGVFVVVDPLDAITGLTQDMVRRDVETWIQQAGIRALTRDQLTATLGRPALYVTIDALQSNVQELKDVVLFQVQVALYQGATLQRLPNVPVSASTWSAERLGFSGKATLSTFVRTGLQELVEKFVAACHEAGVGGGAVSPAAGPDPARPAKAPSPAPLRRDARPLVDAARTMLVRQLRGDQDLRSSIERTIDAWGRFRIVSDETQADVILEVSTTDSQALARLTSPSGQQLWETLKGTDTKDDAVRSADGGTGPPAAPNLQLLGEQIVAALQAFVG